MGIRRKGEPVSNTCPAIDNVITLLEGCSKDILGGVREMEDLRKDNESLRDWGHEMTNIVNDLEEEVETLKGKNEELLQRIVELESQILAEQKH